MIDRDRASVIIRGGKIYDGNGDEPYVADVVISDGRILRVERDCSLSADNEIDARGKIVTPGFIDVHTHYDGQAIWSDRLGPSSLHGVTTVVMGNCGVGFAPCRPADRDLLVRVMEGVEDIPEAVMTTGLPWDWETFPEFLAALDRRRRDIDVLTYLPHSALRVYAMGARGANREPATSEDIARMTELVREAIQSGALGFSTSGAPGHRTRDGDHIPSFGACEAELFAIAEAMREAGGGVFQVLMDLNDDPEHEIRYLAEVSRRSELTVTFSLSQRNGSPRAQERVLELLDEVNAQPGVTVKAQVYPRPIGIIMNHDLTLNPFRLCPSYEPIADLPLAEKLAALRQPAMRAALLAEAPSDPTQPLFLMSRNFHRMFELGDPPSYEQAPDRTIAARAAALGISPEELAYNVLLENEGATLLLLAVSNYADGNLDATWQMLSHPDCVPGLGDGGAHYGLICDSSYPTFMLTHWVRQREGARIPLPAAVAALTRRSAEVVGLTDRGTIAPGLRADINVIDLDRLELHAPEIRRDLPGGGRRLTQHATGYVLTLVAGVAITRDDAPCAARPGRLVRLNQAATA